MEGHDHTDMNMDMNMNMGMPMAFFSSTSTPLYSTQWTPAGPAAYAGTCIFLILLAIAYRAGFALKHHLEGKWHAAALKRRYVVVADKTPVAEQVMSDADSKTGVLTANGVEESIRVIETAIKPVQPWRLSVDVPRAALMTAIAAIGYLLMLAVMTFNVGYFASVLAGTLIGELALGRFNQVPVHP